METPLVTVILPFYNAGTAFVLALRSILGQTYSNWELLLCDDGSNDGSLDLARSIRDPRVVVRSDGNNQGLAERLNECIGRARGTLIARMDADDVSYPERLERQVEFLRQHPEVDVVGCRMLICAEDGSVIGKRPLPLEHAGIVANPALGFGLAHPTWMARASCYRKYNYDPTALRFEDIELLYRACGHSRFANLTQLLYGYREMQGGFRKRFKTRLGRIRYLRARRSELGQGLFLRAAGAEAFKVMMDAGLAATSTRYRWLRLREEVLTPAEQSEWLALFDGLRIDQGGTAQPALHSKERASV